MLSGSGRIGCWTLAFAVLGWSPVSAQAKPSVELTAVDALFALTPA